MLYLNSICKRQEGPGHAEWASDNANAAPGRDGLHPSLRGWAWQNEVSDMSVLWLCTAQRDLTILGNTWQAEAALTSAKRDLSRKKEQSADGEFSVGSRLQPCLLHLCVWEPALDIPPQNLPLIVVIIWSWYYCHNAGTCRPKMPKVRLHGGNPSLSRRACINLTNIYYRMGFSHSLSINVTDFSLLSTLGKHGMNPYCTRWNKAVTKKPLKMKCHEIKENLKAKQYISPWKGISLKEGKSFI